MKRRQIHAYIAARSPSRAVDLDVVGEFGAEISTLLTSKSQALHTSFWDGDLEGFIYQMQARGLDKRMPIIYTTVEASMWRLRDKLPNGKMRGTVVVRTHPDASRSEPGRTVGLHIDPASLLQFDGAGMRQRDAEQIDAAA